MQLVLFEVEGSFLADLIDTDSLEAIGNHKKSEAFWAPATQPYPLVLWPSAGKMRWMFSLT